MAAPLVEFEGTWDEIQEHSDQLRGKRVRVTVIDSQLSNGSANNEDLVRRAEGPSTAESLIPFLGSWEGDDLQDCLEMVHATRSKARF